MLKIPKITCYSTKLLKNRPIFKFSSNLLCYLRSSELSLTSGCCIFSSYHLHSAFEHCCKKRNESFQCMCMFLTDLELSHCKHFQNPTENCGLKLWMERNQ